MLGVITIIISFTKQIIKIWTDMETLTITVFVKWSTEGLEIVQLTISYYV